MRKVLEQFSSNPAELWTSATGGRADLTQNRRLAAILDFCYTGGKLANVNRNK